MAETRKPNDILREWLRADFPRLADEMFPLCLNEAGSAPLLFSHPPLARCASGLTDHDHFDEEIHRAYVYLATYYFCIDAIIDNHPRNGKFADDPKQIAALTGPLLCASLSHFHAAVAAYFPAHDSRVISALQLLLSDNAIGIKLETAFTAMPFQARTAEEKSSIVGRGNLFLFIFEFYFSFYRPMYAAEILALLRHVIFVMQLGDDVGDWRDDFRGRRWTSFLRECFCAIGRIPSEDELEEFIYLEGAYEQRLAYVVNEFENIAAQLIAFKQDALARFIEQERKVVIGGLRDFTEIKRTILS